MINKGIAHIGVFFLYLLSLLPLPILHFFARLLYYFLYYIIGYRKKVVRNNLTNSFPEKSFDEILRIEKTFFKFLADLIFETIKMASISENELKKRFVVHNADKLNQYFAQNQSVLACGAHFGNWEWCPLVLNYYINAKNVVIYKPLHNEVFNNWFYNMRSRFGNIMISMRQTLRAVAQYKNEPTVIIFGNDQTPVQHETQHWVQFLNQPTATQLGIEKVAKQTNRPVFYLKVKPIKRGYYSLDFVPICLDPSKSVAHEITEKSFAFLEEMIHEDPAYWLWSHKRWKFKPTNA